MIVADTTVFVDYLRGRPDAVDAVRTTLLDGDALAASVLTRMELLAGARAHERAPLEAFLDQAAGLWADRGELPTYREQGAIDRLADVGLR